MKTMQDALRDVGLANAASARNPKPQRARAAWDCEGCGEVQRRAGIYRMNPDGSALKLCKPCAGVEVEL